MGDFYFSSVKLLCINDSKADTTTVFADQSSIGRAITALGNAQYDTAQAPTGLTSSMLADGTGDGLETADSPDWDFAGGDFTVEGYVQFNVVQTTAFIGNVNIASSGAGGWVFYTTNAGAIDFYYTTDGTSATQKHADNTTWTPNPGQWYHVAVTRNGANIRVFIDGVQHNTTFNAGSDVIFNTTNVLRLGQDTAAAKPLNGWQASWRVTKGVARYTSDFTPPSLPFDITSGPLITTQPQDQNVVAPAAVTFSVEAIASDDLAYAATTTGSDDGMQGGTPSTITKISQSFTGDGKPITAVKVPLRRSGLPTGTITCELWTVTGTPGSTAHPNTLVASATSSLEAADLTTSYMQYAFTFDSVANTNGTAYCFVLNFSGGDASNSVLVGIAAVFAGQNRSQWFAGTTWANQTDDVSHAVGAYVVASSLSYQWQKKEFGGTFSDIGGATARTYTINQSEGSDMRDQYRVVVTDNNGSTTSNAATLYVRYYDIALWRRPDLPDAGSPKSFILTQDSTLPGDGRMLMRDFGATPVAATFSTGWKPSTTWVPGVNAFQNFTSFSIRSVSVLGPLPSGNPLSDAGWISLSAYSGRFTAGNWTVSLPLIALVAASVTGRCNVQLWKCKTTIPGNLPASPVSLSSVQVCNIVGPLVVGVEAVSSVTFNPGELNLDNEFLLLEIAFEETTTGTDANADVMVRVGSNAFISTPNWTDAVNADVWLRSVPPAFGTTFVQALTGALAFVGGFAASMRKSLTASLAFVGTQAKQTSHVFTGTLSFIGNLVKKTSRSFTATLSFAGAQTGKALKNFPASLSFIGTQTSKALKNFSASLPFVGTLTKQTNRTLTAALSFIGTLTSRHTFVQSLTATLSFIGAQAKRTNKALSGTLSFIGVLAKVVSHIMTATLSFVGTLTKQTSHVLIATLSFIGALTKRTSPSAYAGTLSFSGAFATLKSFTRVFTATLSFIGAQAKNTSKQLSGTLSFIGAVTKLASHGMTAALSFIGNLTKTMTRAFTATLSFVVVQTKTTNKILTATLSFVGTQVRMVSHLLTASLSFVGSLTKKTLHAFTAALSFVGDLTKKTLHAFTATLSFIGAINTLKSFTRVFTGTLNFIGAQTKTTNKALTATLSFVGTLTKRTTHFMTATLSFVGDFTKRITHLLAATLSFVGVLTSSHLFFRTLTATLSFSGSILKTTFKALSGSLSYVGTMTKRAGHLMLATLSFVGNVLKRTSHILTANLSFIGVLSTARAFFKALTATLSFSGASTKITNKALTGTLTFVGNISRLIRHTMSSTLSFLGILNVRIQRLMIATLSFIGTTFKTSKRSLAGTLLSSGTLGAGRFFSRVFTATLSFVGSQSKLISKSLGAALSFVTVFVIDIFLSAQQRHGINIFNDIRRSIVTFSANKLKIFSKTNKDTVNFDTNKTKVYNKKKPTDV